MPAASKPKASVSVLLPTATSTFSASKGCTLPPISTFTFAPTAAEVLFDPVKTDLPHPNTLTLTALKDGKEIGTATVLSVGGGDIVFENEPWEKPEDIYSETTFESIAALCIE